MGITPSTLLGAAGGAGVHRAPAAAAADGAALRGGVRSLRAADGGTLARSGHGLGQRPGAVLKWGDDFKYHGDLWLIHG